MPVETQPENQKKKFNPVLRWMLIVAGLIALIITSVVVQVSRTIDEVQQFALETNQRFSQLESQYAFQPTGGLDSARWIEICDLREAVARQITPETRTLLESITATPMPTPAAFLKRMYTARKAVQALVNTQADQLEAAKMSPGEYRWAVGLVFYECIQGEAGREGTPYRPILNTLASNLNETGLESKLDKGLEEIYRDSSAVPSWVHKQWSQNQSPALLVYDMLVLSTQWVDPFEYMDQIKK